MMGDEPLNQTWVPATPLQSVRGNGEIPVESKDASYPEDFVNMNETPPKRKKRMKMKRHRPKIFDTDKPKKSQKPKPPKHVRTPNPRTPKPANEERREKKKYARKCKRTGSEEETDKPINDVDGHISEVDEASTSIVTVSTQLSCIPRKLDFDLVQNDDFQVSDDPVRNYSEDFRIGKIDGKVPCILNTYKRRSWFINDCLKNNRRLAPIFPKMFKRTRMKQQKRIDMSKLSMSLPTKREARLAMVDSILFGCFCNLRPMVKTRKKRSKRNVKLKLSGLPRWTRSTKYPPMIRSKRYPRDDFTYFMQNYTDAYSQVQDIVDSNLTDQRDEHDLATNNVNVEDRPKEHDVATNNVDVSSHCKNINKGHADFSLELIPRKFPPNLEQNYVLTSRDDAAFLEDLINSTMVRLASLRIFDKNKGKYHLKGTHNKPIGKQKKIPKKPKKAKILVDFDEESLEIWNLIKDDGTWDWNEVIGAKDGNKFLEYPKGPQLLECHIENDARVKIDMAKWGKMGEDFVRTIKLFIDNMEEYLGDRSFSPWKGSVVDSIVGVYLTQNVSDQLSSNAFLSLAAKYPAPSTGSDAPRLVPSTNIGIDQPYLLTMGEDQIVEDGGGTCDYTTNQMFDLNKYEVLVDETTGYPEPSCVKCQEVIPGEYPSPNFDDSVGVEAGDNITSSHFVSRSKIPNGKAKDKREIEIDWDEFLRKYKELDHGFGETDSVDWEAVRLAPVKDIAKVIEKRGMNNILAGKIQNFLNRLVEKHGSIDLEWLRNVPPNIVKDYLLSYDGLGLKSVECIRLLGLQMAGFPVDVNVARMMVRLGLVPLKPLPDNLPLHLLNTYPDLSLIQKYLWPRLSFLPGEIMYKLHHLMIGAGKMLCTKSNPKCEECPMKLYCKHYASKINSSKLDRPGSSKRSKPIVEFPSSPEPVAWEMQDIEDTLCTPKFEKLRTEHEVFVLPDSHILLEGFPKRLSEDVNDGNHYLLAVWIGGDDGATSSQQSNECNDNSCTTSSFPTVAGTILMPARTTVRGAFPLNGTYFQPNEVFADHETSVKPIHFPTHWLSMLRKTKLHCGTNYRATCRDMTGKDIKRFFRGGEFGCNRGFDRATRYPQDLSTKFHFCKTRKYDDEEDS